MHTINLHAMHGLLAKRYEKKPCDHRSNKLVLVPTKSENQVKKIVLHKKDLVCYQHQGTFYPFFTKEIDENILRFIGTNTFGETVQEASQIFSALICVNKFTYMHMDDDQRALGWIKDLSKRFDCTNLDAANALYTRAAKQRYILQFSFYLNWRVGDRLKDRANKLKEYGLDVNFSYEKDYPNPLLQCCNILRDRNGAALWLIENGADVSICTPGGKTALDLARETVNKDLNVGYVIKLLEQAAIKFNSQENIDQSK